MNLISIFVLWIVSAAFAMGFGTIIGNMYAIREAVEQIASGVCL